MNILDAQDHDTMRSGYSFSKRNRLYRLCYQIIWFLFAYWTPPQMHRWRCLILRSFGAKVAKTAFVYPNARIWFPENLELGEFATLGPRTDVYSMAKIHLDDFAILSQGGRLCAGTHDIEDVHFQLKAKPITIRKHAWIAAEAFVGPGVEVGEGAVLGARGCTFKDLKPWTVYVGNPAQAVKERKVRFE